MRCSFGTQACSTYIIGSICSGSLVVSDTSPWCSPCYSVVAPAEATVYPQHALLEPCGVDHPAAAWLDLQRVTFHQPTPHTSTSPMQWLCWPCRVGRQESTSLLDLPQTPDTVSLVDLPEPCLMAVLQCLADDTVWGQRSLFSAARAHSRLHQAAVAVLRSITAEVRQQKQVDQMLQYLRTHSHVDSISLRGLPYWQASASGMKLNLKKLLAFGQRHNKEAGQAVLRQLPPDLQLRSLRLGSVGVQLQPGGGFQGVLGCGVAGLTRLQLQFCELLDAVSDEEEAWGPVLGPALLTLPPGLMHLSICIVDAYSGKRRSMQLDPGVLAATTQLQHLSLHQAIAGGAAGIAQLLFHLQQLQQLTHLELSELRASRSSPPAAAFSALTASSKLQQLELDRCVLPAGVWQYMFPAGRQLPHLRTLSISGIITAQPFTQATSPEGSLLVSCCPGLQFLYMNDLQHSADRLVPLQGLSKLHTLCLAVPKYGCPTDGYTGELLGVSCQLTQLKQLEFGCSHKATFASEGLLLQLTQLKQLTLLDYLAPYDGNVPLSSVNPTGHCCSFCLCSKSGEEPVWRQLLRLHLNHSNPEVAQQAASALAE